MDKLLDVEIIYILAYGPHDMAGRNLKEKKRRTQNVHKEIYYLPNQKGKKKEVKRNHNTW